MRKMAIYRVGFFAITYCGKSSKNFLKKSDFVLNLSAYLIEILQLKIDCWCVMG